MDDFDRVEADREANEGLAYERYWENRIRPDDEDEEDEPDEAA